MEMTRIHSGKLRSIGYEKTSRVLRVEFDDGRVLDYQEVGEDIWRRFSTSGTAWSYYRDNIEEDYTSRRAPTPATQDAGKNPLDALFR